MRSVKDFSYVGIILVAGALLFTACSIHESKSSDGKNVDVQTPVGAIHVEKSNDEKDKKVNIKTPFGGLQVRTDDVAVKETGLTVYPGARQAPRTGNNDSQANVNIATAWFGVKVV